MAQSIERLSASSIAGGAVIEALDYEVQRALDNITDQPMDEIGTLINHETEPHCCGCYIIQYGNNGVGLRALCNECGHTVDLMPVLAGGLGRSVQEEFEALARPLIDFVNREGHPHMQIIVDTTSAEMVEGVRSFRTEEYLRD